MSYNKIEGDVHTRPATRYQISDILLVTYGLREKMSLQTKTETKVLTLTPYLCLEYDLPVKTINLQQRNIFKSYINYFFFTC